MAGRNLFAEPIDSKKGRNLFPELRQAAESNNIELDTKKFSFLEMVKNAPQSGLDLVGSTVEMITKPDESSEALRGLFLGAVEKGEEKIHGMVPEEYWDTPLYKAAQKTSNILADIGFPVQRLPDKKEDMTYEHAKTVDQVIQHFVDRYGSVDEALKTLEKDPFGALADVVGVGSGGAALVNKSVAAAKKALGSIDEVKLLEEAAKFSTTKFDKRTRMKMADNLLEEKIALSDVGLDRIDDIVSSTNRQIDELITVLDKGNVKIPKVSVLKDIEKLKKDVSGQIDSIKDRKLVDTIVSGFLKEVKLTKEPNFTLAKLQEFKKKAYKKVTSWDVRKSNKNKLKDRVYKTISLAGRDVIENIIPETHALNARQGRLIEAKLPVSQSASRIDNLNKIGLDALIKPGVGEMITSSLGLYGVGTAAGLIAHILGRPKMKSSIAQKLRQLKKSKEPISIERIAEAMAVSFPHLLENSGNIPPYDEQTTMP